MFVIVAAATTMPAKGGVVHMRRVTRNTARTLTPMRTRALTGSAHGPEKVVRCIFIAMCAEVVPVTPFAESPIRLPILSWFVTWATVGCCPTPSITTIASTVASQKPSAHCQSFDDKLSGQRGYSYGEMQKGERDLGKTRYGGLSPRKLENCGFHQSPGQTRTKVYLDL